MKAVFKFFCQGCAFLTLLAMILFAVATVLNLTFDWNLGVLIGSAGSRSWIAGPGDWMELLAYEIMLGVFLFFCLLGGFYDRILEKWKKYPVVMSLLAVVAVVGLFFFFKQLRGDVNRTAIYEAIEKNDYDKVDEILDKNLFDKSFAGDFFLEAARFNSKDVINVLLDRRFDINAGNHDGITALEAAVTIWKNEDMADFLRQNGATR
ncbi:MAG: hypothetical protein AAB373_05155 [Patescibacteria group bacterium]